MKYLSLLILFLNLSQLNASDESKPVLKRSEEVITGVKTLKDLAMCHTTGDIYHAACQISRGTQKCPSCRHWDIHLIDLTVAIDSTLRPCRLCDNPFKTTHGLPQASSSPAAE